MSLCRFMPMRVEVRGLDEGSQYHDAQHDGKGRPHVSPYIALYHKRCASVSAYWGLRPSSYHWRAEFVCERPQNEQKAT